MNTKRVGTLLVVCGLLLAAACGSNPTQTAPPAEGTPIVPTSPASTTAALPVDAVATLQPLPDDWDERTVFSAGLIEAEQATLEQLPGASVYHLDLRLADDYTALQGQERVAYTNREDQPLDALYFQLFPNLMGGSSTVSGLLVDGQAVQPAYESNDSAVRVPLADPLQPGAQVVVQMDFRVEIPSEPGGNYGVFGYLDDILVLDGFYPAIPVYNGQGWHAGSVPPNADSTFQDASFYVVRVTAPAALTLVASGTQVERTEQDGRQVVTFAAGPARDFYMAGSERFTVLSQTLGETQVNSYAFEDSAEGAQLALDTVVGAFESFNARFGTYPYTEFDVVSAPMQGAYGIEYPGATGINYTLYDVDATTGGVPLSAILESTVAHEVGHQWFYNVVGNDQHDQPWVDEALVQYVTGLYYLDTYGAQGMAGYRDTWVGRWERVGQAPIPIGLPAADYEGREYGAIVYGRGPLFVEALAHEMGQGTFDAFLRDYYQSYRWDIGTAVGFRQLAEQHCRCDLAPLFDAWVNPPAPGS